SRRTSTRAISKSGDGFDSLCLIAATPKLFRLPQFVAGSNFTHRRRLGGCHCRGAMTAPAVVLFLEPHARHCLWSRRTSTGGFQRAVSGAKQKPLCGEA